MVYILLADGFEEIEALTVVDLLRRAGIDITMVSIMEGRTVIGSHRISVEADAMLKDTDFDSIDMIILPGGMPGTENLFGCEGLKAKIRDFADKGKKLSAICAAPTIYGRMGLLQGKKACCYPGREKDLLGADAQTVSVVKDGNFITSRGMGTAIDFGLAIIEEYLGAEAAADMAEKIVYNR